MKPEEGSASDTGFADEVSSLNQYTAAFREELVGALLTEEGEGVALIPIDRGINKRTYKHGS
jgi:hypothetical protein